VIGLELRCAILQAYSRYYNDLITHRSLDKDAPFLRPVQRIGRIRSHAVLGGLRHQYCESKFSVHTGWSFRKLQVCDL